jgi:hypothetical protein
MAPKKSSEMKTWKARWEAVNERQDLELRRLSVAQRLRGFRSLFALSASSRRDPLDEQETAAVRKTWARLRSRWQAHG